MRRRTVLSGVCLGLGLLAGCSESGGESDRSPRPTPSETSQTTSTPPEVTGTPTVEGFLPGSGDGWTHVGTSDYVWGPLGGTDGVIGRYEGPDGDAYELLVMRDENNAGGSARQFACAGWQIAFPHEGFAVAASTGTKQKTFTPEAPPTMSSTAASNRLDRVRELLVRSPLLRADDVPLESACPREQPPY